MTIETKKLQESCKKILDAIDTASKDVVSDVLELVVVNNTLMLNVSNPDYKVSINILHNCDVDFHAVISARLFLALVSKITTKNIEIDVVNNYLLLKANGEYKLPIIFDENGNMVKMFTLNIENKLLDFNINSDILQLIFKNNSKELLLNKYTSREIQKYFYIDNAGAITFSDKGACVTTFNIPEMFIIYATEKIVKLFKLFTDDSVRVELGFTVVGKTILNRMVLSDSTTTLYANIPDASTFAKSFPVEAVRKYTSSKCIYNININRKDLLASLSRLSLFDSIGIENSGYVFLTFGKDKLKLENGDKSNFEVLNYSSPIQIDNDYTAIVSIDSLKITLDKCDEQYVNIGFGDHKILLITRGNVINVMTECVYN